MFWALGSQRICNNLLISSFVSSVVLIRASHV